MSFPGRSCIVCRIDDVQVFSWMFCFKTGFFRVFKCFHAHINITTAKLKHLKLDDPLSTALPHGKQPQRLFLMQKQADFCCGDPWLWAVQSAHHWWYKIYLDEAPQSAWNHIGFTALQMCLKLIQPLIGLVFNAAWDEFVFQPILSLPK